MRSGSVDVVRSHRRDGSNWANWANWANWSKSTCGEQLHRRRSGRARRARPTVFLGSGGAWGGDESKQRNETE